MGEASVEDSSSRRRKGGARRCLELAGLLALVLEPAASAHALSIEPESVSYSFSDYVFPGGLEVTLEFVAVVEGVPDGGEVLDGAIDPGDPTVVFRVRLGEQSTSLADLAITALVSTPPAALLEIGGAGWVPGPDRDVVALSRVVSSLGGEQILVSFGTETPLAAGQQSDQFFVSWSALAEGDQVGTFVQRCVTFPDDGGLGAGGSLFCRKDFWGGMVVPEPGVGLLQGCSLAAALGIGLVRSRHAASRRGG